MMLKMSVMPLSLTMMSSVIENDVVINNDSNDNDEGPSAAHTTKKDATIRNTQDNIHELGNGLNEGTDPFLVGLLVDSAFGCT